MSEAGAETSPLCPVCKGDTFVPFRPEIPSAIPGIFAVDICTVCGLGLTRPHPTAEDVAVLYPETYYRPTTQRARNPLVALGRYLVGRVLRGRDDLVGELPPGRILDVGCGNGEFLRRMTQRGWETSGTDYSAAAVALASRFVKDVRQGSLEEAHFADGYFDVVSMFHVLEHVPDLIATLAEVWRILADGGRFVIEVPNRRSFGASLFGTHWFALDVPRHLWHFTPGALLRLLRAHRFEVEVLRGATPLSNCYLLFRSVLYATARGRNRVVLFDASFERAGLLGQLGTVARSLFLLLMCAPIVLAECFVPRRNEAIRILCRKVADV